MTGLSLTQLSLRHNLSTDISSAFRGWMKVFRCHIGEKIIQPQSLGQGLHREAGSSDSEEDPVALLKMNLLCLCARYGQNKAVAPFLDRCSHASTWRLCG